MSTFQFDAMDKQGHRVMGKIDASSADEAMERIRACGGFFLPRLW